MPNTDESPLRSPTPPEPLEESLTDDFAQSTIAEIIQELSEELDIEPEILEAITQEAIVDIFKEIANSLQNWTQNEQLQALSQPLMPMIQGFLEQDGWEFEQCQDPSMLRLMAQGKTDKWTCYIQATEQRQVLFYSICPIAIPKPQRQKLAEFLTRANYGMTIGNFELDYTDGEIRYKTSIDLEGAQLTTALIKTLVYTNVTMMDSYLPGISSILNEGISPKAAIALIETELVHNPG